MTEENDSENLHPFSAPDIRRQTIEEADAFIAQKRTRRLVLLYSYKDKQSQKLKTLTGKALDRFKSQSDKVNKLMERVETDIRQLEEAITAMTATHNSLNNLQDQETQL